MTEGAALLIIRSLDSGGSERQLVALAAGLKARGRDVSVMTLYDGGALSPDLDRSSVRRFSLGKQGRWDLGGPARRFVAALRVARPAVVYGFLPTGQLLASAAGALVGSRVVWGIRSTALDWSHYDRMTRLSYWVTGWLAGRADALVANSSQGAAGHVSGRSIRARVRVIPNGIDVSRFRHEPPSRRRLRQEWGVEESAPLIGIAARLDPMKDHQTFLRAATRVRQQRPTARFVVVGDGSATYRATLVSAAAALGLGDAVLWLGDRADLPAVYSTLDVHCSSSRFGEGFSNATAEAMACQVPCAVTDCGDSAQIVGETGRIVPPGDDVALAAAIDELIAADRSQLGLMARRRIESRFSLDAMVRQTESVLWA